MEELTLKMILFSDEEEYFDFFGKSQYFYHKLYIFSSESSIVEKNKTYFLLVLDFVCFKGKVCI